MIIKFKVFNDTTCPNRVDAFEIMFKTENEKVLRDILSRIDEEDLYEDFFYGCSDKMNMLLNTLDLLLELGEIDYEHLDFYNM